MMTTDEVCRAIEAASGGRIVSLWASSKQVQDGVVHWMLRGRLDGDSFWSEQAVAVELLDRDHPAIGPMICESILATLAQAPRYRGTPST
jgi:hypothetical protein